MIKRNYKRTSGALLIVLGLFSLLLQKGFSRGSTPQDDALSAFSPDIAHADFTASGGGGGAGDSDSGMEGGGGGNGDGASAF